jgi:hypothetical protein
MRFFRMVFRKLKYPGWSGWSLIAILITCICLIGKFRCTDDNWKDVEGSDGTGYYSYLPATYVYHDYTFKFIDTLWQRYPRLGGAGNCGFCNLFDGKKVNKYFAGESVLITPFFLVADKASGSKEHPRDGYSFYYVLSILTAAAFYTLLGLWSIRKLLLRFKIRDGITALILICTFFGTNLYYYTIWEPEMSHAYSFGLIYFSFFSYTNSLKRSALQDSSYFPWFSDLLF